MAIGEVINNTTQPGLSFVEALGSLALWLQAIGIVTLIIIVMAFINWYLNRKRVRKLNDILERLEAIEQKIEKNLTASSK